MQELCHPLRCDDGTLSEDCALSQWSRLLLDATVRVGQAANKPAQYEEWMRQVGFVNTKTTVYKWPTNTWPTDGKLKTMGLWNHYNALQGLQGFTIGLFTRILGWSLEKTEAFLLEVRKDLEDKEIHAYWPMWVFLLPTWKNELTTDQWLVISFTARNQLHSSKLLVSRESATQRLWRLRVHCTGAMNGQIASRKEVSKKPCQMVMVNL